MARASQSRAIPGKEKSQAIRLAQAADLPGLLHLEQICFQTNRMSLASFRSALKSPRAWLGVIGRPLEIMAAGLLFFRTDSDAARIYSIAVHPAARGRGLGARMLRRMERVAAERGARSLRLEVSVRNKAALALYRQFGYEETGRSPGYYGDGSDALRFAKRLAPPRPAPHGR